MWYGLFHSQNEISTYNNLNSYECLPCAEGCDACKDASPCVAALNWPMRTSILVLACAVIGFLPPAAYFTFRYQQVKVSTFSIVVICTYFQFPFEAAAIRPPSHIYTLCILVEWCETPFSVKYFALNNINTCIHLHIYIYVFCIVKSYQRKISFVLWYKKIRYSFYVCMRSYLKLNK